MTPSHEDLGVALFNVSVVTDDGTGLVGENCTYRLDTDSLHPQLVVETDAGTNFFNWNHVIYFGVVQAEL